MQKQKTNKKKSLLGGRRAHSSHQGMRLPGAGEYIPVHRPLAARVAAWANPFRRRLHPFPEEQRAYVEPLQQLRSSPSTL